MNNKKWSNTNLESLIEMLANEDGIIRQRARESLVVLGRPAVTSLNQALKNSKLDQVRWEAAKALGEIVDARSIPALVKALEDSNSDVAWLAAEALSKFKKTAWSPLLRALLKNGLNSDLLRQGAHHVLLNQKEDGFNDLLAILMNALESNADQELTPLAASDILKRMKVKS
jgi:HEAT repeat protein